MITLQNIIYPELSATIPEIGMYLRGSDKLRLVNHALVIPRYQTVTFDTYMNFFSIKKWRNLTQITNLILNIHTKGSVLVDIIGVKEWATESFEQVVASHAIFQDKMVALDIIGFESFDALYLRVQTLNQNAILFSANFATRENIRDFVRLAVCVPTYKRPYPLVDNLKKLEQLVMASGFDIEIIIINQGDYFDFDAIFPAHIHTQQQRNLGQTGAIVRAITTANELDCTHVLIVHDDLEILPEAIFRTIRFFQFVIPIRRDVCIAGAILSQAPRWEILQINTLFQKDSYTYPEVGLDVRNSKTALELATCDSQRGSSGWGFTAFTIKMFQAYDYPMPLFIQGSDTEFMRRVNKETISFNGICGWQLPKTYTYSAINEDYYFVRNTIINALLAPKPQLAMLDKLVWQRFWHNIKSYNYIGARLNIYALNHILRKKYAADSEEIHNWVNKLYQVEKSRIRYGYVGKKFEVKEVVDTQSYLARIKVYVNPLKKITGISEIGGRRNGHDFLGKNEVYVLDPLTGNAEIALLKRKKIAQLSSQMIKAYALFRKDYQKIKKEVLFFRNSSTTSDYWQEILNKK